MIRVGKRRCLVALAMLGGLAAGQAWAGRPLGTDDAGTATHGSCQIEAWHETAGQPEHALVLAPACGMAQDVELGADYTLPHPQDPVRAAAGVALKWVPQGWAIGMTAGEINFGLKLATAYEQARAADWQRSEDTVLLLASYRATPAWNLHTNVGAVRQRDGGETARLLSLALTWEPHALWLLFVEGQANDRRELFGQNVQTTGLRYWLRKDELGLDLTASRSPGSETRWTAGFGWYGIGGQ